MKIISLSFLAFPAAVALRLLDAAPVLVFPVAVVGLVPAAWLMTWATEELAAKSGPGVGGLLNVTFGNGPELIFSFIALIEGLHELVKASLVGSILGNTLLVLGTATAIGGWRRERQTFDRTVAQSYSGMLLLAVAVLLLPSLMQLTRGGGLPSVDVGKLHYSIDVNALSICISAVLLVSYAAGMIFSLGTHERIFNPRGETSVDPTSGRSVRESIGLLALGGILVGVSSEIVVGEISEITRSLGVSEFFIGIVVIAIVGNAAEHWIAILAGYRNEMHLAMTVAFGSSAQIALVVAPLLALFSYSLATPLTLVFNSYEIGALFAAILIAAYAAVEGESTWFKGVQLIALYVAFVVLFFLA
jgi:Ca2+:H+ antiporter